MRLTTSTVMGAIVVQNVPHTAPFTNENSTLTPKFFPAGIQITKHDTPVTNVMMPPILSLPQRSLARPTSGLPNAIPSANNAFSILP